MIDRGKALLTLASFEILDKGKALITAAMLGIVPLVLYLAPNLGPFTATEVWTEKGLIAQVLALLFAVPVALITGVGLVGKDLGDKRFGFYLSRPVSTLTIWTGKVTGALIIAISSYVLVLGPAAVLSSGQTLTLANPTADLLSFQLRVLLGLVLAVLIGHFLGMSFRSRSSWTLLDLAALALSFYFCWSVYWRLRQHGAVNTLALLGDTGLVAFAGALFIAGAVQIEFARTRLRLGHRLVSTAAWTIVLVLSVAVDLGTRWQVDLEPDDLTRVHDVVTPASGSSLVIMGEGVRGPDTIAAAFLYNVTDHQWRRIRHRAFFASFSPDGRHVAWSTSHEKGPGATFQVIPADLERRLEIEETGFTPETVPEKVWLGPGGSRIAIAEDHRLAVYDVASGALVAAARTQFDGKTDWWSANVVFRDDRSVRLFASRASDPRGKEATVVVANLDIVSKLYSEIATILPSSGKPWYAVPDPSGERLIVAFYGRNARSHLYGAHGELLSELRPTAELSNQSTARFLADGRIALTEHLGANGGFSGSRTPASLDDDTLVLLRIFSADGLNSTTFELGWGFRARIGFQPSPSSVWVVIQRRAPFVGPELFEVDLDSGQIVSRHPGMRAVGSFWWDGLAAPPSPGDAITRLGIDSDGNLLHLGKPGEIEILLGSAR